MPTEIDIAAGGLLEDGSGSDFRIAVIYRPKHDDWSLPKGHVDPGETIEEGALREVLEETGCTAEIIEIVQPTSYLVKGQPKIVVFYRMRVIDRPEFEPNKEVTNIKWLPPAEAVQQLYYRVERRVVKAAYDL